MNDPVPFTAEYAESRKILRPDMAPLGEWYNHNFKVRATCRCGRVSFLHTGNLIHRFGNQKIFNARELAWLAERCSCIRCQAKGPKLEIIVSKD